MKKKSQLVNSQIKALNVMLIDVDGDKKGMVTFDEAIKTAQSLSLDLVQVSPKNTEPVVCKILDYGKLVFTKKKKYSIIKHKIKKKLC